MDEQQAHAPPNEQQGGVNCPHHGPLMRLDNMGCPQDMGRPVQDQHRFGYAVTAIGPPGTPAMFIKPDGTPSTSKDCNCPLPEDFTIE
jgi:hypothetical protein